MITLVIPAYNEEKRIGRTLENYGDRFREPFELLVVLNGCTDNTLEVVETFRKNHPEITRIINVTEPIGKGGAIRRGFSEALGDYVGFVDADLATPVDEVTRLYQKLRQTNSDAIIASRLLNGSTVYGRGFIRKITSKTFSTLVRFLFDLEIYDTQCGAKIFKKQVIQNILPRLNASDMTIDVDIMLAMQEKRFSVIEEPSIWYDQSSSALLGSPWGLLRNGMKMFFSLLKLQKKYS